MHSEYFDILDTITDLIRQTHNAHRTSEQNLSGARPANCADTASGDCMCIAKPLWWDANGVPRFHPHHPKLAPDIYADDICLFLIACQACEQTFEVQGSWSAMDSVRWSMMHGDREPLTLRRQVSDGTLHYGDPPYHEDCHAGRTMNCWDLRVLEYWTRGPAQGTLAEAIDAMEWRREPELEVALPDLTDPERLNG